MLRAAPRAAAKCSSQNAPCRPQPTARALTGSPKTFSDRAATDYGIDDHSASGSGCATSVPEAADHEGQSRALRSHPHGP
jgi:hypothetical protein